MGHVQPVTFGVRVTCRLFFTRDWCRFSISSTLSLSLAIVNCEVSTRITVVPPLRLSDVGEEHGKR